MRARFVAFGKLLAKSARLAAVVVVAQFLCSSAQAQYARLGLAQFKHTRWTVDDGVPTRIWAITQTPDGYLWLAAEGGLYRFDGVTSERIAAPGGSPMEHAVPTTLMVAWSGDLWVGYKHGAGVAVYRGGRLRDLRMPRPPASIDFMAETPDGAIWLGWSGRAHVGVRLRRWFQGSWAYDAERLLPEGMLGSMLARPDGSLWIAMAQDSQDGVFYLPRGGSRFQDSGYRASSILTIAGDPTGTLWVADASGIRSLVGRDGKMLSERRQFPAVAGARYGSLAFDTHGGVWGATGSVGAFYIPNAGSKPDDADPGLLAIRAKDGLTSDDAGVAFVDREGNIWIAGYDGLDQYRFASVTPEPLIPGDPEGTMIAQDHAGSVYISSRRQLFLVAPDRQPRVILHQEPSAICAAQASGIWAVGDGLVTRVRGDQRAEGIPVPAGIGAVASCAEDRRGRLWLMAGSKKLIWHDASGWHEATDPILQNRLQHAWWGLVETPSGDIAFQSKSDIVRLQAGGPAVMDLSSFNLGHITLLAAGLRDLFVSADGGLARLRGGEVRILAANRFPWVGGLDGLVQTPQGQTWMVGESGISLMATADLDRAFEDPAVPLPRRIFDSRDGLNSGAQGGYVGPIVAAGGDQRVWLLTRTDVAFIDAAHIRNNALAPNVAIRWLEAAGHSYRDPVRISLPAGTRSVEIAYAGLSLVVPQRVQFRYRLDGVDSDWIDPGTRRLASYANLGPGRYRFHLIAANNDGIWNREGAVLEFDIQPTFFQSWPFRLLCGLLLLALLWLAYALRMRAMAARIRKRMAERVEERERIAREIHDTLLQSIQSLTLRFQLAVDDLPAKTPARPALEQAIDQADKVIAEGRDRVRNLRPPPGRSRIEQLIADIVGKQGFDPDVEISITTTGNPRSLDPLFLDEIARIAHEAIFNIRCHARAKRVEIEVRFLRRFGISFADDGIGIDPAVIVQGGKDDHFGLPGMRERADKLHGELVVRRVPGGGTRIDIEVPGRIAYGSGYGWLFRRSWKE